MWFWHLMIKKDDWICALVDFLMRIKSLFSFKRQKLLMRMSEKELVGHGKDIFIILNGPSLKNQDLSVLKGKTTMFVNRGFKHSLYATLKPDYHVFVDPKMLTGEWPVDWIDEILTMAPDITFIMPVSWAFVDKFQPYIKKGVSFYWLDDSSRCTFLGVAGECFKFSIIQKFKTIYFTGFDANGLAHELVNSSSHFYGTNEENLKKTTINYVDDLLMFSRHLHDLNRFARKCKMQKINIVNLTDGGLLDMFERNDLSSI